jgi:ribosomal-protein-alanine N-acetyltransferase
MKTSNKDEGERAMSGMLYLADDWNEAREGDELRDSVFRQMRLHYPDMQPRWNFPPIEATPRLYFERVSRDNAERLWRLFSADTNPFLDKRFSQRALFEEYMDCLLDWMPYSAKYGGADWLVSLRESGEDAGVVHLYNLSEEDFRNNRYSCAVGFATAEKHRNQGIMSEAVPRCIEYAAATFGITSALAYLKKENAASAALLRKLHFIPCDSEFASNEYRYFRYYVGSAPPAPQDDERAESEA